MLFKRVLCSSNLREGERGRFISVTQLNTHANLTAVEVCYTLMIILKITFYLEGQNKIKHFQYKSNLLKIYDGNSICFFKKIQYCLKTSNFEIYYYAIVTKINLQNCLFI